VRRRRRLASLRRGERLLAWAGAASGELVGGTRDALYRPEHRLALIDPDRLLSLVRERVTASIVVQRHLPVRGQQGLRVLGRRAPGGHGAIAWFVDYDDGLDPADPDVAAVADEALSSARGDVGE
jgi:hypothetical protein